MTAPNRTDVVILALTAAEPRSGYDVRQAVEAQLSHFWSESVGNIYPRLKRLHADGLLTKETQRQDGRPDRHVYAVTRAGRSALEFWFGEAIEPPPARNELLLKLFFGRLAPPDTLVGQVTAFRASRQATLDQLEAVDTLLRDEAGGHEDLRYWLMTVRAGIRAARAAVAWADEVLPLLEREEAT